MKCKLCYSALCEALKEAILKRKRYWQNRIFFDAEIAELDLYIAKTRIRICKSNRGNHAKAISARR